MIKVESIDTLSDMTNEIVQAVSDARQSASAIAISVSESAQGLPLVPPSLSKVGIDTADVAKGAAKVTSRANDLSHLNTLVGPFKV